jgi:hypothetical protein
MGNGRACALLAALWVACGSGLAAAAAPEPPSLAEARRLYNQGRFDGAIEAATPLLSNAALRSPAQLIIGRASLEQFRQTADPEALVQGRAALRQADAASLDGRDRLDLLVGLAEALYLEESFGAAAEMFDSVIDRSGELGPHARDQLLDWWATALDRYAQGLPTRDRAAVYDRIQAGMARELQRDPGSAAAAYWMAAAARVEGDLERAWDAALAAFVRMQFMPDRGAGLRPDLDRLVLQGIIPDRARRLTGQPDLEQAITGMAAEWEAFKQRWTAPREEAPQP